MVGGLVGVRAEIIEANDYELKLRLDDGRIIKVRPEVDCAWWDGDVCTDEDWTVYLEYEEGDLDE